MWNLFRKPQRPRKAITTHEIVDIEQWKTFFSLPRLRAQARDFVLSRQQQLPGAYPDQRAVDEHIELMMPGGEIIIRPCDIAIIEQLRDEILDEKTRATGIPVDLFLWAIGEPANRAVTKVGGLPYWPAHRPWPLTKQKTPMTFLTQFNFTDSTDIVRKLPGDILLIFIAEEAPFEEASMRFEWERVGSQPLIEERSIPNTDTKIAKCYGAIHRTYDYPGSDELFEACNQPENIMVLEGTKIGGMPSLIQRPINQKEYLCALGAIDHALGEPYPWLNVAAPITTHPNDKDPFFPTWGDMGTLFISMTRGNRVYAEEQCY